MWGVKATEWWLSTAAGRSPATISKGQQMNFYIIHQHLPGPLLLLQITLIRAVRVNQNIKVLSRKTKTISWKMSKRRAEVKICGSVTKSNTFHIRHPLLMLKYWLVQLKVIFVKTSTVYFIWPQYTTRYVVASDDIGEQIHLSVAVTPTTVYTCKIMCIMRLHCLCKVVL